MLAGLSGAQASADPPTGAKPEGVGNAARPEGAKGTPEAKAAKAEAKTDKAEAKAEAKAERAGVKAEAAVQGEPGKPGMPAEAARDNRGAFRSQLREIGQELKAGKLKKEDVKARIDKLNETRKERQQQHREALKDRFGDRLSNPAAISELRHHERRVAMLDRALLLAQTDATVKNKDKVVARIETLIEKENARHERKMAEFKSATAPNAPGAVVGAAATPQPNTAAPTVPAQAPAGGVK
jgi:hypothetical protein